MGCNCKKHIGGHMKPNPLAAKSKPKDQSKVSQEEKK